MIASVDKASREKSKEKVQKNKISEQKKNQLPLEIIKEQTSDQNYLKGIKSKVDCWGLK